MYRHSSEYEVKKKNPFLAQSTLGKGTDFLVKKDCSGVPLHSVRNAANSMLLGGQGDEFVDHGFHNRQGIAPEIRQGDVDACHRRHVLDAADGRRFQQAVVLIDKGRAFLLILRVQTLGKQAAEGVWEIVEV